MDRILKIKESRLIELLKSEHELNALNIGGVDNWNGCCDAIHFYETCSDDQDFEIDNPNTWYDPNSYEECKCTENE